MWRAYSLILTTAVIAHTAHGFLRWFSEGALRIDWTGENDLLSLWSLWDPDNT